MMLLVKSCKFLKNIWSPWGLLLQKGYPWEKWEKKVLFFHFILCEKSQNVEENRKEKKMKFNVKKKSTFSDYSKQQKKKNPPLFFNVTGGHNNLSYSSKFMDGFQVFFSWKDVLQSEEQLHIFVLQIVLLQIWLKEALILAQTAAEWITHSVSGCLWWLFSFSHHGLRLGI